METHLRNVGAYGDRCCECLFSSICQVLMLKASRNTSGLDKSDGIKNAFQAADKSKIDRSLCTAKNYLTIKNR